MKADGIVELKREQDRSLESGMEISAEERHKPAYPKPSVNADKRIWMPCASLLRMRGQARTKVEISVQR